MTSIGLDTIRKLERIEQLSYSALKLLEIIWQHGADRQFNHTIAQLIVAIDEYHQMPGELLHTRLAEHMSKLNTYNTIFSIDIDRDIRKGVVAQLMHSHVVDAWKIILMQIDTDTIRAINGYLWGKKKQMGLYIEHLQNTFAHKNRARHEQRAIVSMLGKLIKSRDTEILQLQQQLQPIEPDYEMILLNPFNTIGQWFRS
jgi:hypothetical protein